MTELHDELGHIDGDLTEFINPWWVDSLEGFGVDMEDIKVYNGNFVIKCNECTSDNIYIDTCVQHNENATDSCDGNVGICGAESTYGWPGSQAFELQKALDMPQP
eukprot:UN20631